MPIETRSEKRKAASKRRIMGVIVEDDNKDDNDNNRKPVCTGIGVQDFIKNKLDRSNPTHMRLVLTDMETHLRQQQSIMAAEVATGKNEQQQLLVSCMTKLTKKDKIMKISEFDMLYKCDLIKLMGNLSTRTNIDNKSKKRNNRAMETPSRGQPKPTKAPPSALRTARRGEQVFSKDGSPVDQVDEGTIVATVAKKRRGNTSAAFDLNVGDGRYINLADPDAAKHLDSSMKNEAMDQLKVLQDQMNTLMAQLQTD